MDGLQDERTKRDWLQIGRKHLISDLTILNRPTQPYEQSILAGMGSQNLERKQKLLLDSTVTPEIFLRVFTGPVRIMALPKSKREEIRYERKARSDTSMLQKYRAASHIPSDNSRNMVANAAFRTSLYRFGQYPDPALVEARRSGSEHCAPCTKTMLLSRNASGISEEPLLP